MYRYEDLVAKLEEKVGESLPDRLEFARLYWGPRNFDQRSIKDKLGVEVLFDEWIRIITGRNRWLFGFHDLKDMSDPQEVMEAILASSNWKRYSNLWKRKAPRYVRSTFLLLYALVDMTTQGGTTEQKFVEEQEAAGRKVEKSTAVDDARGIDFYVDGKPVQVKSKGTKAAAKRHGKGKDWA